MRLPPQPNSVTTKDLADILGITTQRVEQLAVSDAAFKNDSWKNHGVSSEPSQNSPPSAVHTMSSLQIAEITGKRHDGVLRDIRETLEQAGIEAPQFCVATKMPSGQTASVYHLPRRECDLIG